MMDPNLIKWLNASINDFFNSNKGVYAFHVEGQEMEFTNAGAFSPAFSLGELVTDTPSPAWAELHISELTISEQTQDNFDVAVTLTMMCAAIYNNDDYLIHKITGLFARLMTESILVYRFGDDDTFIGCLEPIGETQVMVWGPVVMDAKNGPLRAKHQSVEQSYKMTF